MPTSPKPAVLKVLPSILMDDLRDALAKAVDAQMKDGVTTFIEVMLNQELGEPFRRDAMKKPVSVAGINPDDMRPQQSA